MNKWWYYLIVLISGLLIGIILTKSFMKPIVREVLISDTETQKKVDSILGVVELKQIEIQSLHLKNYKLKMYQNELHRKIDSFSKSDIHNWLDNYSPGERHYLHIVTEDESPD